MTFLPHAELQHLLALFNAKRFADMAARAQALLIEHPNVGALWKALSVAQQNMFFWFSLVLLPGVVLVTGFVIWWKRR